MQINLICKHILIKFYLCLIIGSVKTQMNDLQCLKYKRLIFEETKTFSYLLPGADEISFTDDHCLTSQGFIVGGEDAQPKEFAFAARLGHMISNGYANWFCGGTVLNEKFVLTAAHCFYAPQGDVNRVRLGELDFDSVTDDAMPEDFNVKQIIEHPDYNSSQAYNDIGLVMLSSSIKFNRYKHPACLPTDFNMQNSNLLIAIGWGHIKFAGKSSAHLQKVTLKSYSYTKCQWIANGPSGKQILPDGLKLSQLCAGSTEKKDTCQGDSGGPLLIPHEKFPCMFNVVGITSLGIGGCAIPNVPAIYTNVSYYIDWITEYVY